LADTLLFTAVLCYYKCYFAIKVSQSRNCEKFARTTVFGSGLIPLVGGGSSSLSPRWLRACQAENL